MAHQGKALTVTKSNEANAPMSSACKLQHLMTLVLCLRTLQRLGSPLNKQFYDFWFYLIKPTRCPARTHLHTQHIPPARQRHRVLWSAQVLRPQLFRTQSFVPRFIHQFPWFPVKSKSVEAVVENNPQSLESCSGFNTQVDSDINSCQKSTEGFPVLRQMRSRRKEFRKISSTVHVISNRHLFPNGVCRDLLPVLRSAK